MMGKSSKHPFPPVETEVTLASCLGEREGGCVDQGEVGARSQAGTRWDVGSTDSQGCQHCTRRVVGIVDWGIHRPSGKGC